MMDIFEILRDHGMLLLMGQFPHGPIGGLACTLLLSLLAITFSLPVGICLGLARLSPWRIVRWPATCWVYIFRGVPLMMVIFWTYFCIPLLIGQNVGGFSTMLCTLVIYESAYIAEIVRGGIQALPPGQYEGARAIGMGHINALRLVILPQALFNSLPSLITQLVSIIKDSTLGYVINVPELTYATNQVSNQLLTKPFQVFAIVAVSYYIICFGLTYLSDKLEAYISKKREGNTSTNKEVNGTLAFAGSESD